MKRDAKHLASGTLFIALGTLIVVGPQYLFKICEQDARASRRRYKLLVVCAG